ncbi:MAG: guanylate kinase [Thiomicrorhabdus sp.]|nr:MAG: guanylate kinase [Thiomicrorhabdus sp.]
MHGSLYIISAPSGAGKTSLVNKLIGLDNRIVVSTSSTTRPIRPGEEDGVNYHFLTVDEFEQKIEQDDFLEHAKVFDNFYGTSASSVQKQLDTGKDVILEIDWQGAQQVRQLIPDAISIFILPPSLEELNKRLHGRGTDSEEIIARRMTEAQSEMSHYCEFDYIVINNVFDVALQELHSIFSAGRLNKSNQLHTHRFLFQSLIESN